MVLYVLVGAALLVVIWMCVMEAETARNRRAFVSYMARVQDAEDQFDRGEITLDQYFNEIDHEREQEHP